MEGALGSLQTSDVVLIKCQLQEDNLYAEADQGSTDAGYVLADGIDGHVSVFRTNEPRSGSDPRDFLFKVVDQLSDIAHKDLRKHLKQRNKIAGTSKDHTNLMGSLKQGVL